MRAEAFRRTVTADHTDFIGRLIALFENHGVRYCLVGGQAVNAYAAPVVSLDVDLVVSVQQFAAAESLLRSNFRVQEFPHSLNVSEPGSDVMVQVQKDPRYFAFVERGRIADVLGLRVPVAHPEDLLQGKVWAVMDDTRRPSKRQKDLADIARLLEVFPELRERVPQEVLSRLF
jgi:hypothetical protein